MTPDQAEPGAVDAVFRRVNEAHLAAGLPPGSPGYRRRLEFALGRLAEGRRAAEYLSGRYPETVRPGARVLDLGCGNGGMVVPFARLGMEATALDLAPHPELEAVARETTLPVAQVTGVGEALPFAEGSFSLVLLAETLEHVERPRRLGRELARILAPGGLVYVTTPPRLRYLFAREPHYGVPALALLPDPGQRWVFERLVAPGQRYDVVHLFWTVSGVLRALPGLELAEITSKNWAGPVRRLDWDWIVARKPGAGA